MRRNVDEISICRERTALIDLGVGTGCLANSRWSSHLTRERLRSVQGTYTHDVDGQSSLHVSRITA
jgi:hypothetical protein